MIEKVRDFINREVLPKRHDIEGGWFRNEKLAKETIHELYYKCWQLKIPQASLPEKYGGINLRTLGILMILEELARGDISLATHVGIFGWCIGTISFSRREDLLEEFADKLRGNDPYVACMCITEPQGGANIEDHTQEFKTIRTIAKLNGDYWIINGHKIWPGPSGPINEFKSKWLKGHLGYFVVITEDPAKGEEGVGLIYVPPDAEGLTFSEPIKLCGFCWIGENREIWFNNVKVPKRYRIDNRPGMGPIVVKGAVIGAGRLGSAAMLVGTAQAVLEIVLEWTKSRYILTKPLRERSLFTSIIAEMFRLIETARAMYMITTTRIVGKTANWPPWSDQAIALISATRSFAADVTEFVINKGMELMGAYGYAYEYNVEKYYRDFKIVKIWLGGPYRDRLDIAQGLYGPFKWVDFYDWVRREGLIKSKSEIKKDIENEIKRNY